MKKKMSITKTDVKDWFIIQRIRILNFIKEHKYISVGIFTFMFAALIGFIVYASDGPDTKVTSAEVVRLVSEDENADFAPSFSEVAYTVNYQIDLADSEEGQVEPLESKMVIIDASLPKDTNGEPLDAQWVIYEESDTEFIIDESSGDLKAEIYNVKLGEKNSLNFYVYLKNISPDTAFAPMFKVYDKKYEGSDEIDKDGHSLLVSPFKINIKSTEVKLTSKVIGGDAYKSDAFNGRYAPFGILLGFEGNYESMKGLYFNPEQTINLSAVQYNESDNLKTMISLDKNEIEYGVYDGNKNGLNKSELSNVYNSGTILDLKKLENKTASIYNSQSEEFDDENPDDDIIDDENPDDDIIDDENPDDDMLNHIYQLSINNIKSDGNLYVNQIDNTNFYTLGSYYVVLNSEREESNNDNINVKLTSYDNNNEEKSSDIVVNVLNQEGTESFDFTLNKASIDKIETIGNQHMTFGDEIILSSIYEYESSWDNNLDELFVRFDLKDENGLPIKLNSYSETGDNLFYYSEEYAEKIEIAAYKLYNEEEYNYDSALSFENISEIESIVFKIEDIKPGSEIEIRLKGIVNPEYNYSSANVTAGIVDEELNFIDENNLKGNETFNITPYKSSTIVYVANKKEDITIDDETNGTTFAIFPFVENPLIDKLGINKNVDVRIIVKLADKMHYVYNEQYILPVNNYGNELEYILTNRAINSRLEPIYIDVNFDVDIVPDTELITEVIIEAQSSSDGGIYKDTTPVENRTVIRKIKYNSKATIVGNLSFDKNSLSKEEPFDIITKLYNNSMDSVNLSLVTLLPYNENMSSKDQKYTGTYTYEIPEGSLCTNAKPSEIQNDDELFMNTEYWKDCNEFGEGEVTAIKTEVNLESKVIYEQNIMITPVDNKATDIYTVYSYIINENNVKNIGKKSVEVFSKKITGVVWEDLDDNGVMEKEENKISDVNLKLYNSSDEMLQEVLSNSRGEYEFNDLREDEYYIIAEFNKEKYYVTTTGASNDISTSSRFEMVATTEDEPYGKAIASNLEISTGVKTISNCNLGLSVKKDFRINVKKYISKIELTNNFGITQTKEYNRENLVKLDVKDINNLKIKVVYLVEVENIGYYPGYVYNIRDYIPTGMTFNENYKENANWYKEPGDVNNVLNNSLSNKLIYAGQKEVLTVAFDITRKEAGSFKNIVEITEDNLEIFRKNEISKGGN